MSQAANAYYKVLMDQAFREPDWSIEDPAKVITDQSPCWIIAVLEIGHKAIEVAIQDNGPAETVWVHQVSLTWAIWKPSHVFGLPFLPLQYKVWKSADQPVLVSQDDVETQGYVKTNFVDIALSFIPADVRVQTVYEVGDLEAVVRWEEMRAGRA